MLRTVRIRNIALAENTTVEFGPGLNVITGETGAGKSMLMGALSLLMGARADKSMIRTGETSCMAEGFFELDESSAVHTILEECGIDSSEDGALIVRRQVRQAGAAQNWINDAPVSQQVLKRIGDLLVDMHGPHDHQSLLDVEFQRGLIDACGNLSADCETCRELCQKIRQNKREQASLKGDSASLEEKTAFLSYRIADIEEADLHEEEEAELLEEQLLLANAQNIQEHASYAAELMVEGRDVSAFDLLSKSRHALSCLHKCAAQSVEWVEELDHILRQLRELNLDISSLAESVSHDSSRLNWIDERLAVYQRMKRKYGGEVADIMRELASCQDQLKNMENYEERLAQLWLEHDLYVVKLAEKAAILHEKRVQTADVLAKRISSELADLGLGKGRFEIDVNECEPGPSGMDVVEFVFAPNKGEEPRPLRMIASSGEMSRVMLAVKTVLAEHDKIPILVFDEIDSNVGGETASSVGIKLAVLAQRHQVLCITHFPQVAVYGIQHFAVHKVEQGGRTVSDVESIDGERRVEEIARMLGGKHLTSVILDHARELIRQGQRRGGKDG